MEYLRACFVFACCLAYSELAGASLTPPETSLEPTPLCRIVEENWFWGIRRYGKWEIRSRERMPGGIQLLNNRILFDRRFYLDCAEDQAIFGIPIFELP